MASAKSTGHRTKIKTQKHMATGRTTSSNSASSSRVGILARGSYYLKSRVESPRDVNEPRKRKARQVAKTQPAARRQTKSRVLLRSATTQPKVSSKRRKSSKPMSQKVMMTMASLVFIFGLGVALMGFRTNKAVEAQVQDTINKIESQGDDALSEQKPTQAELGAYTVDPSAPRYIRINKLNVFARVQKQGLDANGAVKAPGNVHDAGWYKNSSKPGEAGAMLLDGHVAGPTTSGVFSNIKKLQAGDVIEIERGDGQKFNYSVVKSETTPASQTNMTTALLSAEPGKPALNLITCTGKYDAQSGQYEDRIVVYAVQL